MASIWMLIAEVGRGPQGGSIVVGGSRQTTSPSGMKFDAWSQAGLRLASFVRFVSSLFFGSSFVFKNFPALFLKKTFFFLFSPRKNGLAMPAFAPQRSFFNIAAFACQARKSRRSGERALRYKSGPRHKEQCRGHQYGWLAA